MYKEILSKNVYFLFRLDNSFSFVICFINEEKFQKASVVFSGSFYLVNFKEFYWYLFLGQVDAGSKYMVKRR